MEEQMTKKQRREQRKQEKAAAQAKQQKQQTMKRVALWVGVLIVLGGIVWGVSRNQSASPNDDSNNPEQVTLLPAPTEGAHIKGNPDASVRIVEYSDFQCPACGAYFPLVQQVMDEYGDRVSFEYRQFPLQQIHPNAQLAAIATEAADQQGKFWEMHDLLFENQDDWSRLSRGAAEDRFVQYAGDIDLDAEQFAIDLDRDDLEDFVDEDYQGGVTAGVAGTPTFFINGQKIVNPSSFDEFVSVIELAFVQAAMSQESATGTIEGLLTFPSEVLPELTVCAEQVMTKELYCTGDNKVIVSEETPKYTGTGYQLEVPEGEYIVYSYETNQGDATKAYYSEFVTCGLDVNECESHQPVVVTVVAGEIVRAVHPADWYAQ